MEQKELNVQLYETGKEGINNFTKMTQETHVDSIFDRREYTKKETLQPEE